MFSFLKSSVKYNENDCIIKVPVPGLSKEDLEVKVENNVLSISSKKDDFIFIENYSLPKFVDINKVEANCDKGLLEIKLPKKKLSTKFIEIN